MKKQRVGTLLTACALVCALTACSSGNGASGGNSSSPQATATGTKDDDKNKTYTITYFGGTWNKIPPKDGEGLKAINEKFKVDYKPELLPVDDAEKKLPVLMASGDVPDALGFESEAVYAQYAKQGALLPLDDYIKEFESLRLVPDNVWNKLRINGKIYALPRFFPTKYLKAPVIRKDWLDNLGLKMPTNYEELKQVAIAFTKNDPDKNGKDDTVGIAMGKDIVYDMDMGAYWSPTTWYHKNKNGQYIPGGISAASKDRIGFLHELFEAGAIKKDWPLTSGTDARDKQFYAGKAGIFYEQTSIAARFFDALQKVDPKADIVPIPPFVAPDGSKGRTGGSGFYMMTSYSAKLKNDPGKVRRMLQMEDYFRKFIKYDNRVPTNKDYDWQQGGEGKGYKMDNGLAVAIAENFGVKPVDYFDPGMWAPRDEDTEPSRKATNLLQKKLAQDFEKQWAEPKSTYYDPFNQIMFDDLATHDKITRFLTDETTKMIVGQRPLSDWDKMVDDYLKMGGQQVIDEVNKAIQDGKVKGEFR